MPYEDRLVALSQGDKHALAELASVVKKAKKYDFYKLFEATTDYLMKQNLRQATNENTLGITMGILSVGDFFRYIENAHEQAEKEAKDAEKASQKVSTHQSEGYASV